MLSNELLASGLLLLPFAVVEQCGYGIHHKQKQLVASGWRRGRVQCLLQGFISGQLCLPTNGSCSVRSGYQPVSLFSESKFVGSIASYQCSRIVVVTGRLGELQFLALKSA